jgi:CBS-domain-containing membrane protein
MTTEQATPSYVEKFKGAKTYSGIAYPKWHIPLISGLGGLITIAILQLTNTELELVSCFIVPFGASCVLVFAAPAAPFSQPRNVIGGHVLSALVGIAVWVIFKESAWWSLAIANGVAIAVMAVTKTIHPPAGATCFLPILSGTSAVKWAFWPVGLGAVIIVVLGLLYNNIYGERTYPAFWW